MMSEANSSAKVREIVAVLHRMSMSLDADSDGLHGS
jgi:hypothetical protein